MFESEAGIGVQIQMATDTIFPGSTEPVVFPFLSDYKTPSVFDKEPLETTTKQHRFDETVTYTFDTSEFDMMSDLMLQIQLPDISMYGARWVNTTGHSLLDYVSVIHNDTEIARYTGESLHILFQLNTNAGHFRAQCEMLNHKSTTVALNGRQYILYVEIPFFKSNEDKQMFPALLCKRNELQIRVKYRPIAECIHITPDADIAVELRLTSTGSIIVNLDTATPPVVHAKHELRLRSSIVFDSYHLSQEERYLFIHRTGDLLFKRLKYRNHLIRQGSTRSTIPIDFKGSVSEMFVGLRSTSSIKTNTRFKYLKLDTMGLMIRSMHTDPIPSVKYLASGVHKRFPSTYVYTIPFCLSATHTQPSGHVYMQGLEGRNSLTIEMNPLETDAWLTLIAHTYARLVFKDGKFQVEDI